MASELIGPAAMAVLGGALALAGGLAGSAMGIGWAASAGVATLSEDKGQLRNVIVLASLPMTQTFYGLIVFILILTTVKDNMAGSMDGLSVIGLGIFAGLAQFFSAAYQGSICASGISLLPKTKGEILSNSIMLAVFAELLGVLGLVFAIMGLSLLDLM